MTPQELLVLYSSAFIVFCWFIIRLLPYLLSGIVAIMIHEALITCSQEYFIFINDVYDTLELYIM